MFLVFISQNLRDHGRALDDEGFDGCLLKDFRAFEMSIRFNKDCKVLIVAVRGRHN